MKLLLCLEAGKWDGGDPTYLEKLSLSNSMYVILIFLAMDVHVNRLDCVSIICFNP